MTKWCLCREAASLNNMNGGKVDPKYAVEIDVQKLIEDLVWKKFLKNLRFSLFRRCFYRRNDYHIDIRWSYFSFEDFTETDEVVRKEPTESQVQYSTTYTCQIPESQKHIFNANGSQTESKLIKLQKNYNIGGKLSLNVAGLGFNVGGTRQSGNENKTETTTTWSDTTEFSLNQNNSAKVVITHEKGKSEKYFVVKTVLRLRPTHPGWGAPVIIKKKSNSQKVFEYEIISLKELFEAYTDCKDLVEIRPKAHLQKFEDNSNQYYDEVYIFSRGTYTIQEEKRSVKIAPHEEEE